MLTFDQYTPDAAGSFLIQQLTKYDWTINDPLVDITWDRDVPRRSDITIVDDYAAYTQSNMASPGNISPGGKSWVGKQTTAVAGPSVDIAPIVLPIHRWGQFPSWSMFELWQSQYLGRPIDTAKLDAVKLKFEMDTDEQVYVGDLETGTTGLANDPRVTVTNAAFSFAAGTPDQVLAVVNLALSQSQAASGFARTPVKILIPYTRMTSLVGRLVSTAGNTSIWRFLRENTISLANNGRPLEIEGVKWLEDAGVGGITRMVVYTDDRKFVQFPRVELINLPVQNRGFDQILPVAGALGVVEVRYPETMLYVDGV